MSFMKPVFEKTDIQPIGTEEACPDCAYYLASGGESPDEPSEGWELPEIDDGAEYRQVEGDKSFSSHPCDFCGDPLGGDRYDFEQIEHGEFWQWRLSAPGYLDSTEWSYADSLQEAIIDCWEVFGDDFDAEDLEIVAEALGEDFAEFRAGYFLTVGFTAHDSDSEAFFTAPGQEFSEVWASDEIENAAQITGQFKEMLGDAIDFFLRHRDEIGRLGCDFERAGSLFHYSRNGHGVAWSDDFDDDELTDKLQSASQAFGECELQE